MQKAHANGFTSVLRLIMALTAVGCRGAMDDVKLPDGIRITSASKTHVHANISELAIPDLPALTNIHALFTVYFDGVGATDEKLKALTQLRFTNLACVVFTDCPLVTDKGIEALRKMSGMRKLNLLGAQATDASMDVLAGMERLQVVNLYRTRITNTGLARLQGLKELTDVDLRYTRVTSNGIESLRAALPNSKVQFVGSSTVRPRS